MPEDLGEEGILQQCRVGGMGTESFGELTCFSVMGLAQREGRRLFWLGQVLRHIYLKSSVQDGGWDRRKQRQRLSAHWLTLQIATKSGVGPG